MKYGKFIVVAEKPSVARKIREVLRSKGINAVVTSTRGHIMDSELPKGFEWGRIDPLKIFSLEKLDMVIRDRKTYNELKRVFRSTPGILVIATDNDSEGELIGYEILRIYQSIRDNAPFKRMRFNSVDPNELWRAWNNLENDLNWRWVFKAMFRQNFDLVTGAAFTRLLTELARKHSRVRLVSWGSCQTPTLYFVVEREREIESFIPKPYWYFQAEVRVGLYMFTLRSERIWDEKKAKELYEKLKSVKYGVIRDYIENVGIVKRPLPIMTDYLLVDLVKITKLSASRILNLAEELYSEGYISYPRTETDKYSPDFNFSTPLQAVLNSAIGDVRRYLISTPNPRNGRHDDKAHPPIYPIRPYPIDNGHKWVIWEYIARRFVANAYSRDAKIVHQGITALIGEIEFKASGMRFEQEGFYRVFPYFKPKENPLPYLPEGTRIEVISIKMRKGKTQPPKRYSEADLLSLLAKHGIGTDATRATFPKIILDRKYAIKKKGKFVPTALGKKFIEALEVVDKKLVTPDTRRYVEALMKDIENGKIMMNDAFKKAVREYKKLFEECIKECSRISDKLKEGITNTVSNDAKNP